MPSLIVETVDYEIDGTPFQGALVYAHGGVQHLPGLLLAPNWLGVTKDAIRRAIEFVQRGYVVFVVDMYGAAHRPNNFEEAAALANPLRTHPLLARQRMLKALNVFDTEGNRRNLLAPDLRAAVGFCFGGGNVLELARAGASIHAAVSIHGDLTTQQAAQPGDIKAAILALHGSADPVSPKQQRDAFELEMSACQATWQLIIFGNLLHAYTDVGADIPNLAKYDANATERTYALAHSFIADTFSAKI